MRKLTIQYIALLLVTLPLLSVFANDTGAASSRVAVIKEMKGVVKVKKAGGSKEFTAFVKMSLNEGDIITVGASSTAVLKFSNGTSEDDKMTVSSDSTLTFSKLSKSKGTTTRVSILKGSAWIDVKSITSKNDEFTIETPTAIMGVRGTHLLVDIDPLSVATHLTVAAGVVTAKTTDQANPASQDVYATQNALLAQNEQGNSEITIAPIDLELLMKQNDAAIIQAIVEASGEIIKENNQKIQLYLKNYDPKNKDRIKKNVENIVGAIISQALNNKLITQDRLNQILAVVKKESGIKVDLNKKEIKWTEEEKGQQEKQRTKDEAAKKQAEELKKQEDEKQKKLDKEKEEAKKKLEDEIKKENEKHEDVNNGGTSSGGTNSGGTSSGGTSNSDKPKDVKPKK
jgi:hypothetical protein